MGFFKKTDKKYKEQDPDIISWERTDKGSNTEIMHIFPQPDDTMKDKNYFAIKDYENGLFYNKGELIGVLSGGVYELEEEARIKGTEIVWIDTSINDLKWGIPQSNGIPSKDGIIVGLHGNLKFRISDVKTFYQNIVAGNKIWTINDIKDWIKGLLQTTLRDTFKSHNAKDIILQDRELIINSMISKVTEEFLKYGLDLEALNVLGIQVPDGVESLYEKNEFKKKKDLLKEEIQELKQRMDKFDKLLISGNISEDIYKLRVNRIEKRLRELEDKLLDLV